MGLLDQVLGQVIGNMSGGPRGQAPSSGGLGDLLGGILGGGNTPQPGGAPAPAPGGGGGLGGILSGAGGKLSPLLLAVLAILANKNLSTGAGGLGSILHDMLGGGGHRSPDDVPADHAGRGEPGPFGGARGREDDPEAEPPAYQRQSRAGREGGFLDDVGSMLDGPGGRQTARGDEGDIFGGGFDDLQHRFERSGQSDLMGSWIGPGANREPSPDDLERALGPQAVDELSRRTGMDRGELLSQLSRTLPQVVDGLTPDGRLPTAQEQSRWI
jgi:uncharacterized protein YidB (DUF937 family)